VADTLGGVLLVASVALAIWLVVRHRPWLARVGRAICDEFAGSARWYMGAPPLPTDTLPDAKTVADVPDSVERLLEATLTARLLDRTLTRAEYQRAMAVLAADDERQHPMPVPPWP
jgi:hypothetical protein